MNKKRIVIASVLVSAVLLLAPACFKGTIVDLNQDLEITRDVSYATDVAPIFEKSCAISGCHAANGIVPDLSAGRAYTTLTTSNYLDVENPANSELYGFVSGKLQPVMPVGGQDPLIAATILAWIQQGAQNN